MISQNQEHLTQWLLHLIETEYKNDIAIVVHCNALQTPSCANTQFPEFFIPATERGKELACTFSIGGNVFDFYCRDWDYLKRFETVEDYDTMILADSKILYAKSEDDLKRYEKCKEKLFENLNNSEHMKQVALKDYYWAVDIFKDNFLETKLSLIMMNGGYVCDLLVHAIASLNKKYIPHSFTDQYDFLLSCEDKPSNFSELYLKILLSKDPGEIKYLCACLLDSMKKHLGLEEHRPETADINGIADWYTEMGRDWNRLREFADRKQPLNVRGWATKLQYAIQNASNDFGLEEYEILEKYSKDNMEEFIAYANHCESLIKKMLHDNHATLNEFDSEEDFIAAFQNNQIRK